MSRALTHGLLVPDRANVLTGSRPTSWGSAIQEPVLVDEPVARHRQRPRVFAKRLGHFLGPGAAQPFRAATGAR